MVLGHRFSSEITSSNWYLEPGKSSSNCRASASAEARCPPPVSENRKRMFRGLVAVVLGDPCCETTVPVLVPVQLL